MEKELNKIIKNDYNHKMNINMIDVLEFPFPGELSFRGASLLTNLCKNNDEYWISKKEWEEYGSNIILKKCKNILN